MIFESVRRWFSARKLATGRWKLLYVPKDGERILLGSFEGDAGDALHEAEARMVNHVFRQGMKGPVFGTVGIEPE